MKTMLFAFLAMVVIAVGADVAFDLIGFSTQDATSGAAVRTR